MHVYSIPERLKLLLVMSNVQYSKDVPIQLPFSLHHLKICQDNFPQGICTSCQFYLERIKMKVTCKSCDCHE